LFEPRLSRKVALFLDPPKHRKSPQVRRIQGVEVSWFRPACKVTFGGWAAGNLHAASAPAADRLTRLPTLSKPYLRNAESYLGGRKSSVVDWHL